MITMLTSAMHGAAPDVGIAVARVATGLFFALSGINKLGNAGRHASLVATLQRDRVPAIRFMQWWVPSWEFIGGTLLAVGLGTPFMATILAIICGVACHAEAKGRVAAMSPINKADCVDDYLYLPEVVYLAMLAVFVAGGAGKYSLDSILLS